MTISKREKSELYEACLKVKTEIGREKATKVYNVYGWWLSVTCSMSRPEDDLPEDIESETRLGRQVGLSLSFAE